MRGEEKIPVSDFEEKFWQRWIKARKVGWTIMRTYNYADNKIYNIHSPDTFECRNYCAEWKTIDMGDIILDIPSYFWDDKILETGTW